MIKVSYNEKTEVATFKTKCADGASALKGIIKMLVYVLVRVDEISGKSVHGEILKIVGECLDAMEAAGDEA